MIVSVLPYVACRLICECIVCLYVCLVDCACLVVCMCVKCAGVCVFMAC